MASEAVAIERVVDGRTREAFALAPDRVRERFAGSIARFGLPGA